MALVLALCDRIHVLGGGRTIAVGSPEEIQRQCGGSPAPISDPPPHDGRRFAAIVCSMRARLVVRYGAVVAVASVSLDVRPGEVVAIVGPNGAGKTSLLSAIAGLVRLESGEVRLGGRSTARVPVSDVVRLGAALTPEGRNIFATLTVAENLKLGATVRTRRGSGSRHRGGLPDFPVLGERRHQPAGLLSGGEQQMLAIARALMSRPRLLMLDEPSLGLAPMIVDQVYEKLREIRERGVSILVVEQNPRALSPSPTAPT